MTALHTLRRLGLALLLAAGLLVPAAAASAIPASGAGSDTTGTSSSVSSSSVRQGETLRFTVSGFPADHVISVKIADGQYCGSAVRYGSCVVARVTSDASGTASGSITIPSDLTTGSYWLRFLASNPATTNRGSSDFSVVAGTTADASAGQVLGGGSSVGDGSVLVVPSPDASVVAQTVTDDELPIAAGSSAAADSNASESADVTDDGVLRLLSGQNGLWPGAIVLVVSALLTAAAVTAAVVARRRRAASTQ